MLLDAAGNTLLQGSLDMTYNQANRLATVTNQGVVIGPFTYNAHGLRTTNVTPNGTTVFHYDLNGKLIAETTESGGLICIYLWAEDVPIAQKDTALTYLHVDHLNTPRVGTNTNGVIVWQWDSDAFGSIAPNEDPDGDGMLTTVNLRFPGQYFDQETGLHYNYFRDYDPSTGRYTTSDPIGLLGGLNTYSYVGGNPIIRSDPTGQIWLWDAYKCIKFQAEYEKELELYRKEYENCEDDLPSLFDFMEKYGGFTPSTAIYNCSKNKRPEIFHKMIEACGEAGLSPRGPWPRRKLLP